MFPNPIIQSDSSIAVRLILECYRSVYFVLESSKAANRESASTDIIALELVGLSSRSSSTVKRAWQDFKPRRFQASTTPTMSAVTIQERGPLTTQSNSAVDSSVPLFPHLAQRASRSPSSKARIRVKNRRKRYLETHPEYFLSPSLELAGLPCTRSWPIM